MVLSVTSLLTVATTRLLELMDSIPTTYHRTFGTLRSVGLIVKHVYVPAVGVFDDLVLHRVF